MGGRGSAGELASQAPTDLVARAVKLDYDGFDTLAEAVRIGGVSVREGNIVYGDHDGVVVFAPDEAEELLASARKMFDIERQIFERLDEEESYPEAISGSVDW